MQREDFHERSTRAMSGEAMKVTDAIAASIAEQLCDASHRSPITARKCAQEPAIETVAPANAPFNCPTVL